MPATEPAKYDELAAEIARLLAERQVLRKKPGIQEEL